MVKGLEVLKFHQFLCDSNNHPKKGFAQNDYQDCS